MGLDFPTPQGLEEHISKSGGLVKLKERGEGKRDFVVVLGTSRSLFSKNSSPLGS